MSSKRGRKRNDNLPPNRARDVQRAFRARRAAHLLALEQRVTELEIENNCLRAALNLPPANRPLLGKGPTGKDKPKVLDRQTIPHHTLIPLQLCLRSSRESSSADSTGSRASSVSPPLHVMSDEDTWDPPVTAVVSEHHSEPPTSASSAYSMPAMPAPVPTTPRSAPPATPVKLEYPYSSPVLSGAHPPSMGDSLYLSQTNYSPPHRPVAVSPYTGQNYVIPNETREDQHPHFTYSQPAFTTNEMQVASTPIPQVYSRRHSLGEQAFIMHYPRLSSIPSPPSLLVNGPAYAPDGRIIDTIPG